MLFIDNKYTKWYYQIIDSAKTSNYNCYTEKHHIIPKSLGGKNNQSNLVRLTARQHFICHMLLTKMVSKKKHRQKMCHALWAMTTLEHSKCQKRYKNNSKSYEYSRKLYSKNMSENNPMYNYNTQAKRVKTWKKNRANRDYIPPRVLKDKFITPIGVFKTKKEIQKVLGIPEWTLNTIYKNLDACPTNNGRASKKIDHLKIDLEKTWKENGFDYL